MLKNAATYEIMKPEDVGISRSNLVLGKHSGRHAFRQRVSELGFDIDDIELNRAFDEFKKLADRKKDMFDADIEAIIMNTETGSIGPWSIDELHITAGTGAVAGAAVRMTHSDGTIVDEAAVGDGPIDAALSALDRATKSNLTLKNFDVRSVTDGEDAQGEVTVVVQYEDASFRGHGISTDIVEAGALAYLDVINRVARRASKPSPDGIATAGVHNT
jgi:2-isopropylmalate synthase